MLPDDIQTWLFFFVDKLLYHMRQQNGLLRIILKNFKQGVLKMQASENLFLSSHAIASEPRITSNSFSQRLYNIIIAFDKHKTFLILTKALLFRSVKQYKTKNSSKIAH